MDLPLSNLTRTLRRSAFLTVALLTGIATAQAEFRVCNRTTARIGLAIGLKEGPIFITQGWFNLKPNSCDTPIKDELKSGPYYIYGVDYDRGGEWRGDALLCVGDREFYVEGSADCYARGYDRVGFKAISTNAQKNWTLDITDEAVPALPTLTKRDTPLLPAPLSRQPSTPPAPGSLPPLFVPKPDAPAQP